MLNAPLQGTDGAWWDEFFADRSKDIPFFAGRPDENLTRSTSQAADVPLTPLTSQRRRLDGPQNERTEPGSQWPFSAAPSSTPVTAGSYDLVYDCGCFHHLPPHRRQDYISLVARALRPGGSYGLVCFRPEGGSGYTDEQVYERGSLGGGLGYSEQSLRSLWDKPPFSVRVLRQMNQAKSHEPCFGLDFLWAMLATRQDKP